MKDAGDSYKIRIKRKPLLFAKQIDKFGNWESKVKMRIPLGEFLRDWLICVLWGGEIIK